MIAFLDRHFAFEALGMDEGNAGQSVKHMLTSDIVEGSTGFNKYASHNFKKRLMAIQFGQTVNIGSINGQVQKVPAKQWMTDLIIKQAEQKLLIMPSVKYDPDIENQFRNHTYSIGANGTIVYAKSSIYPDHCIDAVRTAFHAKCTSILPSRRKWPTGNAFKPNSSGGWR
jgi:hypothetical protein